MIWSKHLEKTIDLGGRAGPTRVKATLGMFQNDDPKRKKNSRDEDLNVNAQDSCPSSP